MNFRALLSVLPLTIACFAGTTLSAAEAPPREWIDADTGHRVIRLSDEPGTASLYFHQNAYTAKGDALVVTTPRGIAVIDLKTRKTTSVLDDAEAKVIMVGHRSGRVFFSKKEGEKNLIYTVDVASHEVRRIAELPPRASVASLNADETLLLGSYTEETAAPTPGLTAAGPVADAARDGSRPQGEWMATGDLRHPKTGRLLTFAEQKEVRINQRLEARLPMAIFTLDTRSGEVRVVHRATDWLNHLQFSPVDAGQIMFCHEGPWHKVDRLWTIRADGTGLKKIHTRTMNMEIWGHEFFSGNGKTIWYDLQTPRGHVFWLAGYDLATGARTWYSLARDEWSVHFNVSPDGKLFSGDGGDAEMVANAKDGKWIYLFRPEGIPDVAGISAPNASELITPGVMRSERMVNMSAHDYRLEPNVTFTPDGKWLVFRSNMHGATHVYAVEIAKAQ